MSAQVIPMFPDMSAAVLVQLAYDEPTRAAVDIGRGREALREIGTTTADAREAHRVLQMLRLAEKEITAVQGLVLAHFERLEGR